VNRRKNRPLTLKLREKMVRAILDQRMDEVEIARKFGTTRTTVRKWVNRFIAEGLNGLTDRSFLTNPPRVLKRWHLIRPYLDKRQQVFWAAAEAGVIGASGPALMQRVTGISSSTISKRISDLQKTKIELAGTLAQNELCRNAGRKLSEIKDPMLQPALEKILSDETAGDPMTSRRWARRSLRHLSTELKEQGHQACTHTVARLLRQMGYSLHFNKKARFAAPSPDRDAQFRYIATLKTQFLEQLLPIISIDTKKKELIGNYKRDGKSWSKEAIEVDSYFAGQRQCVAVPFGIYDVGRNLGYVTVGISHNTAEFAVNCLVNWWEHYGKSAYDQSDRMLILADGGGGNGYNLRSWKKDLQDKICDAFGLTVTISHYPPGCSKWNPVEYRLFSHISINWAGKPLRDLNTMLAYIRGTRTVAGLKVEARLDQEIYRKGRHVSKRQMKELCLSSHDICPTWNYTISPRCRA